MRYVLCIIAFFLLATNTSCFSFQKENRHKEYIVQFKKYVNKETIESILEKHNITILDYIRESQERGFILLIQINKNTRQSIDLLKQEEYIQNIDPNFRIDINKQRNQSPHFWPWHECSQGLLNLSRGSIWFSSLTDAGRSSPTFFLKSGGWIEAGMSPLTRVRNPEQEVSSEKMPGEWLRPSGER